MHRVAIRILLGLCLFSLLAGALHASTDGSVEVPEPDETTLRYYWTGNALWVFARLFSLIVPGLFLFSGFSARIRSLAVRIGRSWYGTIAVYSAIFITLYTVISLPLSYYAGYVRPHQFGLSTQPFGDWFGDEIKYLGVGLIQAALLLWIPYLLLKKSPRRWWFYTGMTTIPVLFFLVLIYPVVVQPLFDDFVELDDGRLEGRIRYLAKRAGAEDVRIYEVVKSGETRQLSAYVTGYFGTKRIVLFDNLLEKMDDDEVVFVVGHELAHNVLGHVTRILLLESVLILLSLWVADRIADGLIRRYSGRFGFDKLSDIASLPLILLLVELFSLVLAPPALGYSRRIEREADRFALELTQDNAAAAGAFIDLQQSNLSHPRPGLLYKLWRGSHPPLGERIDFTNEYRPWETGEPQRYSERFLE